MSADRHVTQVELNDPPGYFRMARTDRVHLVRRVTRVTWRSGAAHRTVEFWCGNMSSDERGELLAVMPPDALACVGCQQTRYQGLPRARTPHAEGVAVNIPFGRQLAALLVLLIALAVLAVATGVAYGG